MIDYRYKFLDQTEMLSLLEPLGMTYTDEEGNIHASQGGHQWAIWVIGEIDEQVGYCMNLRLIDETIDVSSLEPYIVTPINPKVVWG